jgi:hypothetical protein
MPTATQKPRKPRKPARASADGQGTSRARKPATGRRTAKPNPFDDIARQVNADQEAKDREAGRDDLTPALAKSVDQAKANRSGTSRAATKPAKPARPAKPATPAKPVKPTVPTKVQANGKPTTTFKGRPTSNPTTIAARAKEAGVRVRKDADPADIATRLRATVEATTAWLDSRNGSAPAKAKAVKPKSDAKPPTITLGHVWSDRQPDWLYRCTLVIEYQHNSDGTVVSTLVQVLGPDGKVYEDFWRLPLDYRPVVETHRNGRKLILKGDGSASALKGWLLKEGLASPEDIQATR